MKSHQKGQKQPCSSAELPDPRPLQRRIRAEVQQLRAPLHQTRLDIDERIRLATSTLQKQRTQGCGILDEALDTTIASIDEILAAAGTPPELGEPLQQVEEAGLFALNALKDQAEAALQTQEETLTSQEKLLLDGLDASAGEAEILPALDQLSEGMTSPEDLLELLETVEVQASQGMAQLVQAGTSGLEELRAQGAVLSSSQEEKPEPSLTELGKGAVIPGAPMWKPLATMAGVATQLGSDLLGGLPDPLLDQVGSEEFQRGRWWGDMAALGLSMLEIAVGITMTLGAFGTGGAAGGATIGSGGLLALPAGIVLTVDVLAVVTGGALAAHGGLVLMAARRGAQQRGMWEEDDAFSGDRRGRDKASGKGFREKTRGANHRDKKMVEDAARERGIEDAKGFGEYVERQKDNMGHRSSDNFSYRELLDLADQFLMEGK